MKQLLILLLFIPGLAFAQQIKPVNGIPHEVRSAGNVTFVTQLNYSGPQKVYPISGTTVVYKGESTYADILASGVVGGGGFTVKSEIEITGTGSEESDYIIMFDLHKSENSLIEQDVFLGDDVRTDFKGIRFRIKDGDYLDYYRHSYGNFEQVLWDDIVDDVADIAHVTGKVISYDGNLYARGAGLLGDTLYKSTDNGNNWTGIFEHSDIPYLLFINSSGYIFFGDGTDLYRSTDDGDTFNAVFDDCGDVQPYAFCEDSSNNLYFGLYGASESAIIYKSTDSGANWTESVAWKNWDDVTAQHIHSLYCDPYTNYLYAAVDGTARLIRSVDEGANWTELNVWMEPICMYFGDGFRLFGVGSAQAVTKTAIWRTTDDATFTSVLALQNSVRSIQESDGVLYAWLSSRPNARNPQIVKSTDDGVTWETIKYMNYEDTNFEPYNQYRSVFLTSPDENGDVAYGEESTSPTFFYANGDHYQGCFFVKIPTLPADGTTIEILVSNENIDESDVSIFSDEIPSDLVRRWKIDEGEGTTILDYSGNDAHGTLTVGDSEWNGYGLSRVGNVTPFIKKLDNSLKFSGVGSDDGYITIPYDANLNLTDSFTVVMWVTCDVALLTTEVNYLLSNIKTTAGWAFGVRHANNKVQFTYSTGAATTEYSYSPDTYYGDGKEVMIGFMIDGSDPAKINVIENGETLTWRALSNQLIASDQDLIIGAKEAGSDASNWKGSVNDVMIFDKVLTELEVRALYESRPVAETMSTINNE